MTDKEELDYVTDIVNPYNEDEEFEVYEDDDMIYWYKKSGEEYIHYPKD